MEIFFFSLAFLFFCTAKSSYAKDTLYPGELLYPNQSLVSASGEFKFGFFTSGTGSHTNLPKQGYSYPYYYIGIWLSNTASDVQPPPVDDTVGIAWVGNRENNINIPVLTSDQPAVISLSQNGDLILNQSEKIVWSSNATRAGSASKTVLHLLDTGNLVLRRENVMIWQSFDYPANTWFPGAALGFANINGENINRSLVSWKGRQDPSPGRYSLEIESPETGGFIIRDTAKNNIFSYNFPELIDIQDLHDGLITFNYTNNRSARKGTPYFHLYSNGVLKLIQDFYFVWSSPGDNCGLHIFCGPNALCVDGGISPSCKCPYGFSNMSSDDNTARSNNTSTNCVRNISWDCNRRFSYKSYLFSFYLLQDLTELPDDSQYLGVLSQQECEDACLKNCSCTAYASGIGCNLWYGDLVNIMTRSDGVIGKQLYIRITISGSKTKLPAKELIIGGVALIISITCLILFWVFRGTLLFLRMESNNDQLNIYSYAQIKYATKQFSLKLGGGGFGDVFKGRLPDNTEVAVKKLKILGQEEKQFRSEVQTIGMIRHTNLVRLLGFCIKGTKRLLVYEYMSNGSLDSRLFTECSSTNLSWQERFTIAIGVAKGLTYLHEECRDCIIHCDIKPENVLLDENLVPKIADFGMAKLLGRDLSRVLTTIRGTVGYLAPEWYSGDAITTKADVYSFGMMLLKIISGNRNLTKFKDKDFPYFPFYAMVKINEGEVLCLVDRKLGVNVNPTELIRALKVAGWCIHDSEASRPTMGKVVLMLQGIISVGIPPVPNSFWTLASADDY